MGGGPPAEDDAAMMAAPPAIAQSSCRDIQRIRQPHLLTSAFSDEPFPPPVSSIIRATRRRQAPTTLQRRPPLPFSRRHRNGQIKNGPLAAQEDFRKRSCG